jgi:TP901 family phage tail tape measure protein
MKVGSLIVSINAKTDKFRKGMKRSQTSLQKFRQGAVRAAKSMSLVLAPAIGIAIKSAVDFEQQMAKVSTMLDDAGGKHLPRMAKEIDRLSRAMGQSTTDLSNALYDILSAQIDAAGATDVLTAAAKAAVAGFSETAVAAEAIVTLMKTYKLETKDAASLSDLLFSIVKRGRGTFEDFAPAIGNVAATAANAGLRIEELAAAFSTMTRGGLKADVVATAINSTLMAFLKPTNDARQAAEQLGLELSANTLRTEGLIGVVTKLAQAEAELTAQIIPNRRALKGLMTLLQDVEGYYEDVEIMTNRAGETQEALGKATDTAAHQLKQMRQEVAALARALGADLLPALKQLLAGFRMMTEWGKKAGLWIGARTAETVYGIERMSEDIKALVMSGEIRPGESTAAAIKRILATRPSTAREKAYWQAAQRMQTAFDKYTRAYIPGPGAALALPPPGIGEAGIGGATAAARARRERFDAKMLGLTQQIANNTKADADASEHEEVIDF